jgi:sulfate transport system substrate-binding protein
VIPRVLSWAGLALALLVVTALTVKAADSTILNVSYDVSRELYKDINPAFAEKWKAETGDTVTISQSHGGSSKQTQSVAQGLEADVVTMNQAPDIDFLADNGSLVAKDWKTRFPNDAAPYTTTSIFLVRKGNPKGIKDWDDLVKPGVGVIVPNPKTSGNGRYTYLAAWGYALKKTSNDTGAREFVAALFKNVPVLDGGGRGATTTFTQRGVGDVLVTFENEAALIAAEVGADQFDVVYPSLSIEAPAPVAVVDANAEKHGTAKVAAAYLNFLYTPQAQEIIAKHHFRPRDAAILEKNKAQFPAIETFSVETLLGPWSKVLQDHFASDGTYDQIALEKK